MKIKTSSLVFVRKTLKMRKCSSAVLLILHWKLLLKYTRCLVQKYSCTSRSKIQISQYVLILVQQLVLVIRLKSLWMLRRFTSSTRRQKLQLQTRIQLTYVSKNKGCLNRHPLNHFLRFFQKNGTINYNATRVDYFRRCGNDIKSDFAKYD